LALPGGSLRCSKWSGIETAADDLPASSAPPLSLTSEKQPRFSGDNEPLAVLVIEFRLRQFLFGLRSALARCEH
jgi:hypothetical protein